MNYAQTVDILKNKILFTSSFRKKTVLLSRSFIPNYKNWGV